MWLRWTPALDLATLALAQRGVSNLALGQRDSTDSLSIVLSMVDSNNHYYGPLSLETFDTLLQIDAALGAFFTFLDATVGENRYVVALSSDHGFPEVPEFRAANGRPGRRLDANAIDSLLKDVGAVVSGTPVSIASRVAEIAEGRDFVAEAFTPEALSVAATSTTSESPDHFLRLYQNSYRPDRVPRLPLFSLGNGESSIAEAGVMIRLEEGTMIDIDAATHGSPYDYDRRVPLIFMGAGVKRGVSHLVVRTVDIAPTLADFGKVKAPPDLDGRVLKLD
jgi:arylsulfatase A-like enzyme